MQRAIKNVIAYGGLFPGDEDRMHQPNECLRIERFVQMNKNLCRSYLQIGFRGI